MTSILRESERLWTQQELAERLRVSVELIRRWRRNGKLGFIRLGHCSVRIPESEVARLLHAGCIQATENQGGNTHANR